MPTYDEYAVIVDDGPSKGYILPNSYRRNRDQAQRLRNNRQQSWDEKLKVVKRTVTVTPWEELKVTEDTG